MYAENDVSLLGNIYIGKVQNIARNIQAAFVEVGDKKLCFLPLSDTKYAYVRNRKTDGSLRCGDEILVQVEKDAVTACGNYENILIREIPCSFHGQLKNGIF